MSLGQTDQARDERFMALALAMGRRALGTTAENPPVGCVIEREGRILARGWTQPGGRPHAEVHAMERASSDFEGATAYVTLEPCAHHGKTPPCAEALIAAGIARVVVAAPDPDPRVNGRGVSMLRAAGVTVREGVLQTEAEQDLAGFLSRVRKHRPHVTLKLATSWDGRIATGAGESQWITGPAARRQVHLMRAQADAVMVGGGTARVDDPSLTVRELGLKRAPIRAVVSRRLDLPLTGTLAQSAGTTPLWLLHGPDLDQSLHQAWQGLGARLFEVPVHGGQLDPQGVLRSLADGGVNSVLCEGGGMFAASLLHAGLVDRVVWFVAGMALGAEGYPGIGPMGLDRLADASRFDLREVRQVGADIMQVWDRADQRTA